ncbi:hypothetical protein ACNKHP_18350 [Shigella boydii]
MLGGSFDCAIVVDDYRGVLNQDGSFPRRICASQNARCDWLSCSCAGHNIGALTAYKSGHVPPTTNPPQAVLRKQEAWEYVTFQDDAELPLTFKAPSAVLA